jgi:hypothetical protein
MDETDKVVFKLIKVEEELQDLKIDQQRREGFKYYAAAVISVATMIVFYFAIIPVINFLYLSTKEASEL